MTVRETSIHISKLSWFRLVSGLKARGAGVRESGAVLLGRRGRRRVKSWIFYDDLDSNALSSGIITLDGAAMIAVFDHCEDNTMEILADVHTHGGSGVGQSYTDQSHPVVRKPGHTAMILPFYARRCRWSLTGCGIYEYLGDHRWRTCEIKEKRVRLTLL